MIQFYKEILFADCERGESRLRRVKQFCKEILLEAVEKIYVGSAFEELNSSTKRYCLWWWWW
jgi:hypothetical protein